MSADVASHDEQISKPGEAKAACGSVQICSCNQDIVSYDELIGPWGVHVSSALYEGILLSQHLCEVLN